MEGLRSRAMTAVPLTTWHLQMTDRPARSNAPREPGQLVVQQATKPNPALNRFFYFGVGSDWLWRTRRPWTWDDWDAKISARGYQTWVGTSFGSPCGYFELDAADPANVEIVYFGLLPVFVGAGLGPVFLGRCLDEAWANPATERVWLHTCTFDHPRALPNYLNAGFEIERTTDEIEQIEDVPFEPWPSSGRLPRTTIHDHLDRESSVGP